LGIAPLGEHGITPEHLKLILFFLDLLKRKSFDYNHAQDGEGRASRSARAQLHCSWMVGRGGQDRQADIRRILVSDGSWQTETAER
jgi:hypothetical protein